MSRRRTLIAAVIAVFALAASAFAAREALVTYGVRAAVGTLGYQLDAQRIRLTTSSLEMLAPDVRNHAGEPVFRAARVDVGFSLRDLLPGSHHRFGLTAVDVQRPYLTLIHHADGTYNVALPGVAGPPARPDATPIDLRARVRDGTVALIDRFVVPNQERRESLTGVRVDAVLSPHDPAYYRIDAALEDGARSYPLIGRARFDHRRGFASQHWHADELPVGPLIDFAITTHDVNLVDGRLHEVDALSYGFMHEDGTTGTHLGGTAELRDGKLFVAKLGAAVGDARGTLRVYDDGLTTTGIDATLAHVPLHLVGGLYGLAHPQLRFVLDGAGPLARLRTLAPQTAHLPLAGDVAFALRADGALGRPVVRGTLRAAHVAYGAYALHDVAAEIAVSGTALQIVGVRAGYGPIALRGRGSVDLGDRTLSDVVASVSGPANALPYAGAVLPGAALQGLVVLHGVDAHLAGRGAVSADGASGTLDAPFALDADGSGTIGPVALARNDGASLYARVGFDRTNRIVDAVLSAHRLSLRQAASTSLPGLPAAALPPVAGRLDADLIGELHGNALAAASGALHLRGAGIAGLPIGDADATLGGDGEAIALRDLNVHGPLGELRGDGAYSGGVAALEGRFSGPLDRLARLAHVDARGRIDAPLRIVANGRDTVVQIADARFAGARVRGIPVERAAATIELRGRAIDVHDARLDAAGGSVVAQGSFGNGGTLRISASGIDASALRAAGVPIAGGRIVSVARVGGTASAPRGEAGVTLSGAHVAGAPLDALAAARYDGGRLRLDDVRATYAGAVASATGTVDGIGRTTPRLAVGAGVRGADVASFTRRFRLPLRAAQGGLDADVRIAGTAGAPSIAGSARIDAGSINGLAFHDVVVPLRGGLGALDVRGGRATVGSTALAFDAAAAPGRARVALHSARADLSDFNDYFDAADTLAGRGRFAATIELAPGSLTSSGDVALQGMRLRRFPLGDVDARWASQGRTIAGNARVGGAYGRLDANGSATLPARDPVAHLAASAVDLRASLAAFDLGTWLPVAGISAPVTGRVDGGLRVRGTAPHYAIAAAASLHQGLVGRVPIRALTLAGAYDGRRGRLTQAHLEALNLVADGSGSFGASPSAPLDLTLRANTPDAGALARGVTGRPFDAAGALTATVHVAGNARTPAVSALADLQAPRYGRTQARHAHADVAYGGGRLVARDVSVDLAAGRVAMNGSVPATLTPPFVDRRTAPIAARLVAQGIDLAQFDALLPHGTTLGGLVDGDVAVSGTAADPQLRGSLALAKGAYVSPQLASQVRNATLHVAFAGHTAAVRTLHADVGGGAIDGDGQASIGDLRDPARTLALRLDTRERNVGLDVPYFFRGKLDGTLSLTRAAMSGAPLTVAGNLGFSHARIPLAALLLSPAAKSSNAPPPPVAFDLTVALTRDDRVQSPNVDIGTTGSVTVGGTLAHPTLAGAFASTDGTLSLYRVFTLQSAQVAFDPSAGIVPEVDALATTHVPDPSTDVLLHAHGPATGLTLDLSSRPTYDKAQIIGLLAGAQSLGAVNGVARTTAAPGSGSGLLQGAAIGYVDQQFTRGLFEPFSSSLGHSLGLSNLNLNAGLTGGFSASATRALSEKLSTTFSQSTDPQQGQRQSVGLAYNASDASALQLTLYDAGSAARSIGVQTPTAPTGPTNYELQALAPPSGSSGYVFTFVRKFP